MHLTLDLPDTIVSLLGDAPERTIYALIKAHLSPPPAVAPLGRPVINAERDQEILDKAVAGATHAAIANEYGISTIRVSQIVARGKPTPAERVAKNVDRDAAIADESVAGSTYIAIANKYNLSSIRVSQIVAQGKVAAQARQQVIMNARIMAALGGNSYRKN
jgi:Mor family transcriptional regulator